MKKLVLAIAGIAMMTGVAFSEDLAATVKSYDSSSHLLTLDDGKSFTLDEQVAVPEGLAAGKKVTIQFDSNTPTRVQNIVITDKM